MKLPGLPSLWAETLGDPSICVAVLDGPVDRSHPCFDGVQLSELETLASATADQGVASQHGTHIASIIFGQHGSPVRGIAPGCRGLIVPVFKDGANGLLAPCSQIDLARAIIQSVEQGAHVINISGGELVSSGDPHPLLANAVRLCVDNGVLIVAAAGNEGCQCLHVPAAAPSALAVGAMDDQGVPMNFSNWGQTYQTQGILAPGENIVGAVPGGGIIAKSGTSFATPLVSGIVGLLLSIQLKRGAELDPFAIRAAILRSASPCNPHKALDCRRFLVGSLNIVGAHALITGGGKRVANQKNEVEIIEPDGAGNIGSEVTNQKREVTMIASEHNSNVCPEETVTQCSGFGVQATELRTPDRAGTTPLLLENLTSLSLTSLRLGHVYPSDCGCGCDGTKASSNGNTAPALVYALGEIGYDFGTEARRGAFAQAMGEAANPHDFRQLMDYLEKHPYECSSLIWTLNLDATPIYAIQPVGPFANVAYERLCEFMNGQLKEGVQRVSIPGYVAGKTRLLSGQEVPVVVPEVRGMYSWSTDTLVQAVLGEQPKEKAAKAQYEQRRAGVYNFLERVYYGELRNLGLSSQERAMNFAATNAFQITQVFGWAAGEGLELDTITVEPSPVGRPGSDCWDVKLVFFDPTKRQERARKVYRFTVDVSDVVPVTVGKVRSWSVY